MTTKKKTGLTPEAARILEQYRNAGNKGLTGDRDGNDPGTEGGGSGASRPTAPPPSASQRRSGTRGK